MRCRISGRCNSHEGHHGRFGVVAMIGSETPRVDRLNVGDCGPILKLDFMFVVERCL